MKRLLCVCLALLLVCTLLPGAKAEEEFRFTRENFPRLDGSTSMVPLGQGIASVLLGETREEAASLIFFNRTTQSFRNLCSGQSDLVIAAEPKAEVFDEMAQNAFPYAIQQIATEALVFVVNENNPVNSLTRQQVRDIYSGKITNWSQVGGEDLPIAAFQRNPTAGSQVMMEKLVMDGTPMMEAPAAMIPGGMGELIESVRSYDNSANAIGYTVYYYATDMQMAQGLKILKIDGVTPSPDTLRSGEYPFLNGYYACVSALAAQDSPERLLYDWLISQAGQDLLALEGYVPVYGPGEAPTDGSSILTDYSCYTPNGGVPAKYTVFDCPQDHLEPRKDYGNLFPYDGAQVYGSWGDDSSDYQAGSLMGFFNHQGQLITGPIYTGIYYFALEEEGGDYLWLVSTGENQYGLVAKDGSFATELCYDSLYRLGDCIFASTDYAAGLFQLLDRKLNVVATQEDFRFDGESFIPMDYRRGLTLCVKRDEDWNTEYIILDQEKNILLRTRDYLSLDDNGVIMAYDENWNISLYDRNGDPIELPEVGEDRSVLWLAGRFYQVYGDQGQCVIDAGGSLFEWNCDGAANVAENCFSVLKNGKATVYDQNGRVKYAGVDPEWYYLGGGVFSESTEDTLLLHKLPENKSLSFPNGSYAYPIGEVYLVSITQEDGWYYQVLTKELELLPQTLMEFMPLEDQITGEDYVVAYNSYGFAGEQRLLAMDCTTQLFQANGSLGIQDGFITVSNDWAFTCYNPQGEVIFCYPYYGMASGD